MAKRLLNTAEEEPFRLSIAKLLLEQGASLETAFLQKEGSRSAMQSGSLLTAAKRR